MEKAQDKYTTLQLEVRSTFWHKERERERAIGRKKDKERNILREREREG